MKTSMLIPRHETGDGRGFAEAVRREMRPHGAGRHPGIILARGTAAGQMPPDRRNVPARDARGAVSRP